MELYYDEVDGDILIIKADGGLNGRTADQLIEQTRKLVEAGLRKLIIDCSTLDYISSSGLGTLVRLHKQMVGLGGDVKVAGVKGLIVEVLRLTRLSSLFEIYPDVSRARLAFRPKDKEVATTK